ncbi:hypothetical protein [uncultured Polaribacter sp.]|uniref:hypothetical protein n=1 Tax=uncultured Polaribacter sp. TaxID=174711 RepID=UPI002635C2A3|nr:hypothetical protein [uncultured Polaribacter sp.]
MKKIKKYNVILLGTLLLFSFVLIISCENPLKDFKVAVDTAVFDKNIQITVFDPVNPINLDGSNKLNIELLGEDATKIVSDGGSKTNFPLIDGVLQLAVNPAYNTEDLRFIVRVSGKDYLTTTIPVNINQNDTLVNIFANIVNIKDTPNGVSLIESIKPLKDNKLNEDLIVITDDSGENEFTQVEIIKDTEFRDEAGNELSNSGDLKVRVVNFDSQIDESLNSFPGGFSPDSVELENGEIDNEGSFSTAGFVSIDMFVGGVEVKEFSKPITITMEVDRDVVNPNTGAKVKIGDLLPVWSYSKDDGVWKYHTETIIQENNQGNLFVKYTTTHLSWYNLDYWLRGCDDYRRFDVKISAPGVTRENGYRLATSLVYAGTNQNVSYKSNRTANFYDGKSFGYYRTPNTNLQFVVYEGSSTYAKGKEVYRSNIFNGCDFNQISINLNDFKNNLPPQIVNVNINFSGVCDSRIIKPSSFLYMLEDYTNYRGQIYKRSKYVGYIRRGKITLYNITLNKEYEFQTYYKGRVYNHKYTFTSENVDLENFVIPDDLCNSI